MGLVGLLFVYLFLSQLFSGEKIEPFFAIFAIPIILFIFLLIGVIIKGYIDINDGKKTEKEFWEEFEKGLDDAQK